MERTPVVLDFRMTISQTEKGGGLSLFRLTLVLAQDI